MDLLYSATPPEIVIELDARADLLMAGQLLPSYNEQGTPNYQDLTDEQCEANEAENNRRVDVLDTALRAALREIGEQRFLTIYVGDCSEVTHTPLSEDETLERVVWQEAHDIAYEFIPEDQSW